MKKNTASVTKIISITFLAIILTFSSNLASAQVWVAVTIESPKNTTYTTNGIPVVFTYKSPYPEVTSLSPDFWYTLDGSSQRYFTPQIHDNSYRTVLSNLPEGQHTLQVWVMTYYIDGYFKLTHPITLRSRPITFTINTLPPQVSIISIMQMQTCNNSKIPLIFSVDDPITWLGYKIGNSEIVTISGNTTLKALSEALQTLTVYAKDDTGKTGTDTVAFRIATSSIPTPQSTTTLTPSPIPHITPKETSIPIPNQTTIVSPTIQPSNTPTPQPTTLPNQTSQLTVSPNTPMSAEPSPSAFGNDSSWIPESISLVALGFVIVAVFVIIALVLTNRKQ